MIFGRKKQQDPSANQNGTGNTGKVGNGSISAGAGYPPGSAVNQGVSGTGGNGYNNTGSAPVWTGNASPVGNNGGYGTAYPTGAGYAQGIGQTGNPYGNVQGQTGNPYAAQGVGQTGNPYGNVQGQTGNPYVAQGNWSNGNPYAAQGMGQNGNSYGAQGANQNGIPYGNPQGSGYGMPYGNASGNGYTSPGANPYGQNGYPYATGQAGHYGPQGSGYGTAPYGQQGGMNAPPQGYQQGYGYSQMGRTPGGADNRAGGQIPLNGGGYVPPAVPVKKAPRKLSRLALLLIGVALLALFVVGLVTGMKTLQWVFAALAAVAILALWIGKLTDGNGRLCFTIVFAALALVAVVNAGDFLARPDNTRTTVNGGTEFTAAPAAQAASTSAAGIVVDPRTGEAISTVENESTTPTPPATETEDTSAADRLERFFYYWRVNKQDEMLQLCSPSWASGEENAKAALFGLMANRTPLDYMVEKISGTEDDTSRKVTVASTMDRNNGKDAVKYRLTVLMVKEGNEWYVDPSSLKSYEKVETVDPASEATATPTAPPVSGDTILYYNPNGGEKYHADERCKSVHEKYLPLKGTFRYSEVNDEKYKNLQPCNVCAAPLR